MTTLSRLFYFAAARDMLKKDVRKVYENGKLRLGVLAGGKSGSSLTYTHTKVRGDVVEWFDGSGLIGRMGRNRRSQLPSKD